MKQYITVNRGKAMDTDSHLYRQREMILNSFVTKAIAQLNTGKERNMGMSDTIGHDIHISISLADMVEWFIIPEWIDYLATYGGYLYITTGECRCREIKV